MSSTYETYTDLQLDEAEANLMKQIERIRKERKSRNAESSKTFSLKSLISSKEEKPKKKAILSSSSNEEEEKPKKKTVIIKKVKDDTEVRAIKATISSMKEVLDYHHVDYPSSAKKDELSEIVRKHNLVRECEKKESIKKS